MANGRSNPSCFRCFWSRILVLSPLIYICPWFSLLSSWNLLSNFSCQLGELFRLRIFVAEAIIGTLSATCVR